MILLCATAVAVTLGVLLLARILDDPGAWVDRFRQFRLWQVVAAAAGLAVLFALAESPPLLATVAGLAVLVLFARVWIREFLFLMDRREDDFPARLDKTTWVVLLVALAPVGLWLFRAYRLAHWPETAPKPGAVDPGGFRAHPGPAHDLL